MIELRVVSKYKVKQTPAVFYVKNYNPSYTEESALYLLWSS
ncbi:hypothetical protein ACN09M_03635 [Aliarcobacter butzleri]